MRRFKNAIERRRECDILTRYNFCIDSMPQDDQDDLDKNTLQRIEKKVKCVKLFQAYDLTTMLIEVSHDYVRCMNKMLFDSTLQDMDEEEKAKYPVL